MPAGKEAARYPGSSKRHARPMARTTQKSSNIVGSCTVVLFSCAAPRVPSLIPSTTSCFVKELRFHDFCRLGSLNCAKIAPKVAQDGPNLAASWLKLDPESPKYPKLAPRWPKVAQVSPNWPEVGPKLVPRWFQGGPSWSQSGPKLARGRPSGPKLPPSWAKLA